MARKGQADQSLRRVQVQSAVTEKKENLGYALEESYTGGNHMRSKGVNVSRRMAEAKTSFAQTYK